MEIKDYLHLYLMCKFQWKDGDGEWRRPEHLTAYQLNFIRTTSVEVRLILRPLSSMTEEEEKEIEATKSLQRPSPVHHIAMMVWTAESYRLALSMGFDLFNLIPAGLAIDRVTTLKH